jgi:hypothetical protein
MTQRQGRKVSKKRPAFPLEFTMSEAPYWWQTGDLIGDALKPRYHAW